MTWRREAGQRPGTKAADAPIPGRPLDPTVRGRMETRLGHDFSTVRVHHGPDAKALHARAFTVGEDVTFAPGQFAPGTPDGDRLLAHELGHVVEGRHGAPPGAYRAPDDGPIPSGPERPLALPRAIAPTFGLGSVSLGLGVLDSFAFNGSELTPDHRKQIARIVDQLASLMVKMPGGRITVAGHTDVVGGEQAKLDLGRKRAVAVAAALADAGVPPAAMDVGGAGESAPVVQSGGREPRNRRVEVRFAGAPIGSEGEGPRLRLGPPEPAGPKFDPRSVTPPPIFLGGTVPGVPPWWQRTPSPPPAPATPQPGQVGRGKPEPQTKAGSVGDVVKAVAAVPKFKKLIDDAEAGVGKDLGKLTTPDIVVLGTVGGAIAAGAIAGLASDPAARKEVLDLIDGKKIPVPWAPGFAIVPHTKGGAVGVGVSFDLIKIFGGGKR
jgi:outer membrane protein OmpA-like peptidoglycan-associated protein